MSGEKPEPTGKELLDVALQRYVTAFAENVAANGGRLNFAEAVAQGKVTTAELSAIRDELEALLGNAFADSVNRRLAAKLDQVREELGALRIARAAEGKIAASLRGH